MPIYYKIQHIGTRRVDFLVEGVVSVEIKALTQIEDVHLALARLFGSIRFGGRTSDQFWKQESTT